MFVIKRSGQKEEVKFDKVTARIERLSAGLDLNWVDPIFVARRVIEGIYDGVKTSELDLLAAEIAASLAVKHPDYARLAARIAISNLQKNTSSSFAETVERLYQNRDPETKKPAPLIAEDVYRIVQKNKVVLDAAINYERDFDYDYFGFKTLERSYLLKIGGEVVERPQHLLMRVAVGIHKDDLASVLSSYELMSQKWFTHATPTLFNAGTPQPSLSSCFLMQIAEDSIDGIFKALKDCAKISQSAGGIGLSVHKVRANGSYIRGTAGISGGIIPMLRVYNDTSRYIDQGGGKRKGAIAIYLEPWHADIYSFLELRKNSGKEELRARDLFTALWIPDLFMQRVEEGSVWSLFSPHNAPGLSECWGEEFEELYKRYEKEGKARQTVEARDLWFRILESQVETGTPYMLYKDACNAKSNQQHLGTIQSSNLCAEIVEYSSAEETAVCNLASIALPRFVQGDRFDFQKLLDIVREVVINLNGVIDVGTYPVKEAAYSNAKHRPIGIGVQGLADVFQLMRLPFESQKARELNRVIFETMYFGALKASKDLAKEKGAYETFKGSPLSRGLFQFDLWGVKPKLDWDWQGLKKEIEIYGIRNSLLMALMPTASTSQILGNSECFEPYISNIFVRRVLSGEFIVFNKHLINDLIHLGLWNEEMRHKLMAANGSVQHLNEIPKEVRDLYKTVWEIPQRSLIDMAADRAPYICQTQSLNLYLQHPTLAQLTSMHFYTWKKKLKTGMYYFRTSPASEAIKFTVDRQFLNEGCDFCES